MNNVIVMEFDKILGPEAATLSYDRIADECLTTKKSASCKWDISTSGYAAKGLAGHRIAVHLQNIFKEQSEIPVIVCQKHFLHATILRKRQNSATSCLNP